MWQVLVVVDVAAGGCYCGAGACGGPTVKKNAGGGLGVRAQSLPPNALVAGNHCRC